MPLGGIFARYYGMRIVVDRRSEGLEMFMFDDACIRHVGRGVVDDGVALMIGFVEYFGLEVAFPPGPRSIIEAKSFS